MFMDRTITKMKRLEQLYNIISWHLRDLIEEANSISELDSILDAILNSYNIGTLRDLDFRWLMDELDKKRWALINKED